MSTPITTPATPYGLGLPTKLTAMYIAETPAVNPVNLINPDMSPSLLPNRGDSENNAYPYNTDTLARHAGGNFNPEKGMHLHWLLPYSFRTTDADGNFPKTPDRWLVTRIVKKGGAVQKKMGKSWIVESNYLWDEDQHQGDGLNIHKPLGWDEAIKNTTTQLPPYSWSYSSKVQGKYTSRALGRRWDIDQWPNASPTLQNYWNALTALGTGSHHFAAYYPNCSSVFGAYDDLADITNINDYTYTYIVEGWFYDLNDDPVQTGAYKKMHWQIPAPPSGQKYSYCVCQGITTDVSPAQVTPSTYNLPIKDAQVAVGESMSEALSCLLANQKSVDSADRPAVEHALNGIQLGLAAEIGTPQGDADIREKVQAASFSTRQGGIRYRVHAITEGASADNLPAPLKTSLAKLNHYQIAFESMLEQTCQMRWQLYADWTRYLSMQYTAHAPNLPAKPTFGVIKALIQNYTFFDLGSSYDSYIDAQPVKRLEELLQHVQDAATQLSTALSHILDVKYELVKIPAAAYYTPNAPVLLFGGEELKLPSEFINPPGNAATNLLSCNLLNNNTIAKGMPAGYSKIVLKNVCGQWYTQALKSADHPWSANNWKPIGMEWEIGFSPLVEFSKHAVDYPADTLSGSTFQVDFDATQADLVYAKDQASTTAETYRGTTLFNGKTATRLIQALEQYKTHETGHLKPAVLKDIEKLIAALDPVNGNLPLSAQTLDGFTEGLLMQFKSQQPELIDPCSDEAAFGAQCQILYKAKSTLPKGASGLTPALFTVPKELTGPIVKGMQNYYSLSSDPGKAFNPLRAGMFDFDGSDFLNIIDFFGQRRSLNISRNLYFADRLKSDLKPASAHPLRVAAPPRIAQSSRVNFNWIKAGTLDTLSNQFADSSPVCGWMIPNFLDQSLLFYTADGHPLGSFHALEKSTQWRTSPNTAFPINAKMSTVIANADSVLKSVMLAIYDNGQAQYFSDLLTALEKNVALPRHSTNDEALSVLMGHPLAIVRCRIDMEVQGLPSLDQSWDALKKDCLIKRSKPFDFSYLKRQNAKWNELQIPLELGQLENLNDGTMGYFINTPGASGYKQFYSSGTSNIDPDASPVLQPNKASNCLQPGKTNYSSFYQGLGTTMPEPKGVLPPHQQLTLIIDPRADVHLKTGVLPIQAQRLDDHYWKGALQNMNVNFMTPHLITALSELHIPLPTEAAGTWHWTEVKMDGSTPKWTAPQTIKAADDKATFNNNPSRVTEGWINISPWKNK